MGNVQTLRELLESMTPDTPGYCELIGQQFQASFTLKRDAIALHQELGDLIAALDRIPQQCVDALQERLETLSDEIHDTTGAAAVEIAKVKHTDSKLSRPSLSAKAKASAQKQYDEASAAIRGLREELTTLRSTQKAAIQQLISATATAGDTTIMANLDPVKVTASQLGLDYIDVAEIQDMTLVTDIHSQYPIYKGTRDGTAIALKQFFIDRPSDLQAFHQELQIRESIGRHDNILPADAVVYDPMHASVMYVLLPWCEYTLATWMEQRNPTFAQKYNVMTQMVAGVEYLHTQGVVHKDLKPSNILIDEHNHVWITDFGHSKEVMMQATGLQTTVLVGTKAFRDPDLNDLKHATFDSDMYSLGMCMYTMFFTYDAVTNNHPSTIPPHANESLRSLLASMILAVNPADRPTLLSSQTTESKPLLNSLPFFSNPLAQLEGHMTTLVGPTDVPWKLAGESTIQWSSINPTYKQLHIPVQNGSLPGGVSPHARDYISKKVFNNKLMPAGLKAITIVHKLEAQAAFFEKLNTLSHRYNSIPTINVTANQATDTMKYINTHYPPTSLPGHPNVQLRQAFHGVSDMQVARAILNGGFMVRCTKDDGWYGRGIYMALDMDYARYYGKYVIVCDVLTGNVHSVTTMTKKGQSIEPDHDSHMVVVDHSPTGKPQPTSTTNKRLSGEVVIAEASQILPRCILHFN